MAEISVIVPVYNVEKYLRKCLDSILNQTFKDLEIIAINDCSPDNSFSILKEYETKGIKVINLEKNVGLSAVRNIGINKACGKYISFVDSDDWLDKNFYEKLYSAAEKHEADIAVCGIKHCHTFGLPSKYLKFDKEVYSTNIEEKFEICNIPKKSYVWNKIYRLDKLREYNIQFVEGMAYEDIMFTPEALYYTNKLVTVPDTYYNYLVRKNSIVATKSVKNETDNRIARAKAQTFCTEHNISVDFSDAEVKKYKIFGLTIFKKIKEYGYKKYFLLNFIRWQLK